MKNRVLFVLVVALAWCALGLPFLTHAQNRLVTGTGIDLLSALNGNRLWLVVPACCLILSPWMNPRPGYQAVIHIAATFMLTGLVWIAGSEAALLSGSEGSISRTSFGGGVWLSILIAWLIGAETSARLTTSTALRALLSFATLVPTVLMLISGQLDQTSLLREYANRQDVFDDALVRHLLIVTATLIPTLLIGVPLGVASFRKTVLERSIFSTLNVIQTIPSIAMFGLLIAPLAALSTAFPRLAELGIAGIGVTPAVIALTLYSLLPITRSTHAGLQQVPKAVVEAAQGMGLTRQQILWKVELPIAFPVFLSGLRIAAVQAVGLTMVAALIGAGGFGALMFQGLSSSALDLVLLGVIPVVGLAVIVDAVFKSAVAILEGARQ